jgi:hypothetical protein
MARSMSYWSEENIGNILSHLGSVGSKVSRKAGRNLYFLLFVKFLLGITRYYSALFCYVHAYRLWVTVSLFLIKISLAAAMVHILEREPGLNFSVGEFFPESQVSFLYNVILCYQWVNIDNTMVFIKMSYSITHSQIQRLSQYHKTVPLKPISFQSKKFFCIADNLKINAFESFLQIDSG